MTAAEMDCHFDAGDFDQWLTGMSTNVTEPEQVAGPSAFEVPDWGSRSPFYSAGYYQVDLDGAPASIFEPLPGLRRNSNGGPQSQVIRFSHITSHLYKTDAVQEASSQGQQPQASGSGGSDIQVVYVPYTTNVSPPTTTTPAGPTTPYPTAPSGINPEIFAGAIQVATTTAAGSSGNWPTAGTEAPHAPPPPQQFYYHPAQLPPPGYINPQAAAMVTPYYPPPPPPPHYPQPPQPPHFVQAAPPPPPPATEYLSEYPYLYRTHHTAGYSEGVNQGRNMVSQSAFDTGFPVGVDYGRRIGRILGMLEIFALLSPSPLAAEAKLRAYQELDGMALWRDDQIEEEMSKRGIGSPAGDLMAQPQTAGNGYGNPNLGYYNVYSFAAGGMGQQGQIYPFFSSYPSFIPLSLAFPPLPQSPSPFAITITISTNPNKITKKLTPILFSHRTPQKPPLHNHDQRPTRPDAKPRALPPNAHPFRASP
jgi:Essential protein Yae1, N terminal